MNIIVCVIITIIVARLVYLLSKGLINEYWNLHVLHNTSKDPFLRRRLSASGGMCFNTETGELEGGGSKVILPF